MTVKNYYEVLGLTTEASAEEIRIAYKKLAKAYHPDKHQGDAFFVEKFKDLQEAYDVLSDAEKRKEYDDQLARQKSYSSKKDNKKQNKSASKAEKTADNTTQSTQPEPTPQPSQPQPEEVKDLHSLVEMYFKKRSTTLQARKEYDAFLATPKKRYINWVKFIVMLLYIAAVIVAWQLIGK